MHNKEHDLQVATVWFCKVGFLRARRSNFLMQQTTGGTAAPGGSLSRERLTISRKMYTIIKTYDG
eukprot:12403120-Karenia_brevis.AAC.1